MQPQAGFGTPQEEIDRLYDYMVPQMKCDDMKYIGSLAHKFNHDFYNWNCDMTYVS